MSVSVQSGTKVSQQEKNAVAVAGLDQDLRYVSAVKWSFRAIAVALGAAQTILARNAMNPDGRSYLEIAQAYLHRDWSLTLSTYWQPFYSWLLAAMLGITGLPPRQHFVAAHVLNFLTFLACMAAFEFFWDSLLRYQDLKPGDVLKAGRPLPAVAMWILGYSIFIWLFIQVLIPVVGPDLAVATVVLVDAAFVLRLVGSEAPTLSQYALLGAMLGLGYLIKAILFPTAFILLATVLVARWGKENRKRLGVTFAVFLCIAGPLVAVLSYSQRRFVFADTGKLVFAWYNYDVLNRDWEGEPPGSGTPVHTTRKVYDHPAVYEFNGPIRSSYPPWFNPAYWNEGLAPHYRPVVVAKKVVGRIGGAIRLLAEPKALLAGVVLLFLGVDLKRTGKRILRLWIVWLPAVAVLSLYILTVVVPRYMPAVELLLWAGVLGGIWLKESSFCSALARWVPPLVALGLLLSVGRGMYWQVNHVREDDATPDYKTADGIKQLGLSAGAKVAAIGFNEHAYWPYLDDISIIAEINTWDTCEFWRAAPAVQAQVLQQFVKAGAVAVVVNAGGAMMIRRIEGGPPLDLASCARPSEGWDKIPGSPNYIHFLK